MINLSYELSVKTRLFAISLFVNFQVLWYVLETYASTHDVFLYLDSDAVINDHDLSLSKFLSNLSWAKPSKCKEFNINSCHVAFAYDTWNKNDSFVVPNSGIYLFQATPQFRQFLQVWWHLNMHESNFFGFYEQDSLWNLLENIPSPAARRPTTAQVIYLIVYIIEIFLVLLLSLLLDKNGIIK